MIAIKLILIKDQWRRTAVIIGGQVAEEVTIDLYTVLKSKAWSMLRHEFDEARVAGVRLCPRIVFSTSGKGDGVNDELDCWYAQPATLPPYSVQSSNHTHVPCLR